jgi:hypothetical protein
MLDVYVEDCESAKLNLSGYSAYSEVESGFTEAAMSKVGLMFACHMSGGIQGYYVASKLRFFTTDPIHRISSRDGCYLAMGCLPLNITNRYFILRE